jgi:histidine decarboxylase
MMAARTPATSLAAPWRQAARRAMTRTRAGHRLGAVGATTAGLDQRLIHVLRRLDLEAPRSIGYPVAVDIDYRPLAPFLRHLLNNIGDPRVDPIYYGHTKDLEREVLDVYARLFRAPDGWAGYITSGGSEGNLYGLWLARTKYPNAVVYHSVAAHYSVAKACHLLGLPNMAVAATANGEIDYASLRHQAGRFRGRPAIVVATVGTTFTEAIDDVWRIHADLDAAGIAHRYVHSDAAFAGIPRALTHLQPGLDPAGGADSISISGHKWIGTPLPCGAVIARRGHRELARAVRYTGSPDTTVSGSRSGLAAVMLWYANNQLGEMGHLERTLRAQDLAAYACQRLTAIGWRHWRNPDALTIMVYDVPQPIRQHWRLPTVGGWSHIICAPGITRQQVDALIAELHVG